MATRSAQAFGLNNASIAQPIPSPRILRTMDARSIFAVLRPHVLAARPEIGTNRGPYKRDKTGRKRYFQRTGTPIYGRSTFRNVVGENGKVIG